MEGVVSLRKVGLKRDRTDGSTRIFAGGHAKGRKGENEGKNGIALAKATQINENKEGGCRQEKG